MQATALSVSAWYFFMGLFFSLFSSNHAGNGTHWGYALSGMTCLIIAAWFATLHVRQDSPAGKGSLESPHPETKLDD